MSTCSTATSVARDGRGDESRRHASCDHAVRGGGAGGLERRWRDLEREWDAYKTSRCSGGPATRRRHHRRSRSATGTPLSAVVAAEPVDAPGSRLLGFCLRGSPRRFVSSLQRTGSSSGSCGTASAGVTAEHGAKNQIRHRDEENDHDAASSVCSVDADPMAAASSCSCFCSCAVPGCGCGYCHSSSNSPCSSAATSLFSLRDEEAMDGKASKTEEARWTMGSIGRFLAIAVVGVVLVAAMATAILEFAVDDGQAEFLVPT